MLYLLTHQIATTYQKVTALEIQQMMQPSRTKQRMLKLTRTMTKRQKMPMTTPKNLTKVTKL